MNSNRRHRCPRCGMLLNSPKKAGQGYKCRTNGCDAQKIWIDSDGNVVRELLSSVVREEPLTHIVFNEDRG